MTDKRTGKFTTVNKGLKVIVMFPCKFDNWANIKVETLVLFEINRFIPGNISSKEGKDNEGRTELLKIEKVEE